MRHKVIIDDNLSYLETMPDCSIDLIYIDPPFNTGKAQQRTQIKTIRSENGDRKGFQDQTYETVELGTKVYNDKFDDPIDDYLMSFLKPRLIEARRILKDDGSLYFHIDFREVHSCRILLDQIFGEECFLNEIIWAYDYGGRSRNKWPAKHDNILVYAKNPLEVHFNKKEMQNIKFKAPNKGKKVNIKPSDGWWHTIVPTNSRRRTGYPTQKPVGILNRIILASSDLEDTILDFFAGSGSTGESCHELGRKFILIDNNPQAYEVMKKRFNFIEHEIEWIVPNL
ncbi:MAG: site-specific DNA-methyltransferase [Anaerolineales bacterium]|nr:site-specific DNA-methyltransferase [Anaerolineales bacterium]